MRTTLIIGCALLLLLLADILFTTAHPFTATVIDKQYKPTFTATATDGRVQTSEEQFLLIVKTGTGKVVTAHCKPELYYLKTVNAQVVCNAEYGWLTGITWGNYINQ